MRRAQEPGRYMLKVSSASRSTAVAAANAAANRSGGFGARTSMLTTVPMTATCRRMAAGRAPASTAGTVERRLDGPPVPLAGVRRAGHRVDVGALRVQHLLPQLRDG